MTRPVARAPRAVLSAALALSLLSAAPPEPPHVSRLFESTTSEIVLIEFWAQDEHGAGVPDLAASDITLIVDSYRRPIASFERVLTDAAAPAGTAAPVMPLPPPAGGSEAARARRFVLFFNDALSKAGGMTQARRAAIEFVTKHAVAGDQFALASSEEHRRFRLFQEFTDDRNDVVAALQRSLADPARVSSLVLEMERPPSNEGAAHRIMPSGSRLPPAEAMSGVMSQVMSSGRTMFRGLEALIELLAPYRGPKAILYFSDGLNGVTDIDIEEVTRAAAAAQVTINVGNTSGLVAGTADMEVAQAMRSGSRLATFADETGGLRTLSNDVSTLFRALDAASSGAYVLSFVPEGPADGRSHSLRLSCSRKGVTLRYRHVFVRETPEVARGRRLEAAFIAPGLHAEFGLDAMVPAAGSPAEGAATAGAALPADRQARDLLLYVPADRLLFVPGEAVDTAQVEIGAVALDAHGKELGRLSRRMQIRLARDDGARRHAPLNLLMRGAVPAGTQSVTAVLSDLDAGSLGAARIEPASEGHVTGLAGLAIGDADERSLWLEVPPAPDGKVEAATAARPGLGGARRVRFTTAESPVCEVRLAAPRPGAGQGLRLVVADERRIALIQPLDGAEIVKDPRAGLVLRAHVPLRDVEPGEFILRVEEMRSDGPFELGRLPLRIQALR